MYMYILGDSVCMTQSSQHRESLQLSLCVHCVQLHWYVCVIWFHCCETSLCLSFEEVVRGAYQNFLPSSYKYTRTHTHTHTHTYTYTLTQGCLEELLDYEERQYDIIGPIGIAFGLFQVTTCNVSVNVTQHIWNVHSWLPLSMTVSSRCEVKDLEQQIHPDRTWLLTVLANVDNVS